MFNPSTENLILMTVVFIARTSIFLKVVPIFSWDHLSYFQLFYVWTNFKHTCFIISDSFTFWTSSVSSTAFLCLLILPDGGFFPRVFCNFEVGSLSLARFYLWESCRIWDEGVSLLKGFVFLSSTHWVWLLTSRGVTGFSWWKVSLALAKIIKWRVQVIAIIQIRGGDNLH